MKGIKGYNFLIYAIVPLAIMSCMNENLLHIEDNTYYKPNYSLPVGTDTFRFQDIIDKHPTPLIEIPDTSLVADTISYFLLNDAFFSNDAHFRYSKSFIQDFSNYSNKAEYITSLMIRTNIANAFPANTFIQVYFYDIGFNLLDSLYKEEPVRIGAAQVNSDGYVDNPTATMKINTYFGEYFFDLFPRIYYIVIQSLVIVEDFRMTNVRFYSNQELIVQIGFQIGLNLPVDEI